MRRLGLAVTVIVLSTLPAWAWAGASLTGPSGLIAIPTAEVLGMANWNVGASVMQVEEGADKSVLYADIGLLPRLEVGFAREDFKDAATETLVNAKLGLALPVPGNISLAAGVVDATDQIDRSIYVVASHKLGAGLLPSPSRMTLPQVHVGIGGGRFDGLFAGISTIVDRRVEVMAEYDSDDFNFGARWTVAPNLDATVAAMSGLQDLGAGLTLTRPW